MLPQKKLPFYSIKPDIFSPSLFVTLISGGTQIHISLPYHLYILVVTKKKKNKMGFLHQLWDETLAGPTPDAGLGKLRKQNSQNVVRDVPISRSITILRTTSSTLPKIDVSPGSSSVPSSPASPSTPVSPFSPSTPRENLKKLTRRKSSADALRPAEPKSPTGYDWIVLSSLDR